MLREVSGVVELHGIHFQRTGVQWLSDQRSFRCRLVKIIIIIIIIMIIIIGDKWMVM